MNVGIFVPENNELHRNMLLAFAEGIKTSSSIEPYIYNVTDYHPVDIAVVFGIGKKDVPISWPRGNVIKQQVMRGKKVIIIEKGFVRRDAYFMAGFNGLNNFAEFYNSRSLRDRWDQLDIELKPVRNEGDHIIVCGQVPSDASVQHMDIIGWCANIVRTIKKLTNREIIFRPHPLAINRTPAILGAKYSIKSLEDDFKNAHAVITFNSNAAVESIIEGIPAFSFDQGSMAWDVTGHNIATIEHPHMHDDQYRQQWANNIAYAQWTKQEFESGLPWMHLVKNLLSEQVENLSKANQR